MKFTAQSSQSPTVFNLGAASRSGTLETDAAETLVRTAEEAVRLALIPSVEGQAADGQDPTTETSVPLTCPGGDRARAASVFSFPPRPSPGPPRATLHALQEWEGYVVEIHGDELVTRLVDLTAGSTHEEEEAFIPLAEISESDLATVSVGSIFRWVIGYEKSPAGTKKRVSQIVFRDLPRMTERDFREGRSWAHETMRAFER